MSTMITREILENYLKCPYKAYLQLACERGSVSDYELLHIELRKQVRTEAEAKLVLDQKCDVLRNLTLTPDVLKRGFPLLVDVTAEIEGMSIHFDGIRRSAGSSRLGDFHYVPILFHEGETLGQNQKALLELLGLILEVIQRKMPLWGILIHGQGREVRKVKLGGGTVQAQRTLQQIKEMHRTGTPPSLRLNSHCYVCEFCQRCQADATSRDDLSLLRSMGTKEIIKCNRRGIFTVTQLSCTFRAKKHGKRAKQKSQPHQHALKALAIRDNKIYVIGNPELPAKNTSSIYFDVEGDPERGFDYLLGMIVDVNGSETRYSFWADTSVDEARIFQEFLDILSAHGDFQLYTYGSYEATFLRRMIKTSNREDFVKNILDRSLNVLSIIYQHIYFPTYSNGLKEIGRYLGFNWTETNASGVQSIVWRRRWEDTGSAALKEKLTTYNIEDCLALRKVTQFLYSISPPQQQDLGPAKIETCNNQQISHVEQIEPPLSRREWCHMNYAIRDFEFVNERAHFDYQQDKVFIRTNTSLKRKKAKQEAKKRKKRARANRCVEMVGQECLLCGGSELIRIPDRRLVRLAFDLRITRNGVRRRVTRYTTTWHSCTTCGKKFLPPDYLRLDKHCHSLKSWGMYEHVAHYSSFASIAERLHDCFDLPVYASDVHAWQGQLAQRYEATYRRIVEKLMAGHLIHADETEVHLRGERKGYVWVFTSLDEVIYMYRESREGSFLPELLKGFRGVLASDFYAAYDSIDCEQQKCLVHLMRDFNHDLLGNPWDEELKALGAQFGKLMRTIVATVDNYGLRRRHLIKHQRDVDNFYNALSKQVSRSDLAEGYRIRLIKNQEKLFTFLKHDNVPWNNNNAEHAVKRFARYRALTDGRYTVDGLNQYLLLLSVNVTCQYKRVDFLNFLLSREMDIDTFAQKSHKETTLPAVELVPDGVLFHRSYRKQTWNRESRRQSERNEETPRSPAYK